METADMSRLMEMGQRPATHGKTCEWLVHWHGAIENQQTKGVVRYKGRRARYVE